MIYFLLFVASFTFPKMPEQGLDPSWRMVMGYVFDHGLQFGRDVVWTYGPLGFIMSNTYSGIQFWSLIGGQLLLALIAATVIIRQGYRLIGVSRLIFFGFILLFGIAYEDALHMLVIAMLGFELLRESGNRWNYRTALIGLVLAFYSQIKFTDCTLSLVIVVVACGYSLWQKHRNNALLLAGSYVVSFLVIWALCGQHLSNLPAYFRSSWSISQGYQWAMGVPSPIAPFWKGLVVLFTVVVYAFAHLKLNPFKPRAVANVLVLGAFIYINWKHGFVRSDGHMIGFFFCAMLPLAAYPALLDDPDRFRFLHRWVFVVMLILSVLAVENALYGVSRGCFSLLEGRIWGRTETALNWKNTRQSYRDNLAVQRVGADLYHTREIVGKSTIDILGVEQNVALFNRFNYAPRPVMQSYSTFNPFLAQLNGDYYASDRAPDFVLVKIQTVDGRLPIMDDSIAMMLVVYRYEFVRTEKGFLLWKKNPGPFDAAKFAPKLIHADTLAVDQPLDLKPFAAQALWLKLDLKPSLLGVLRAFFYKPPSVLLNVKDVGGNSRDFLMPVPMARSGFLINPFIDDPSSYMEFAASRSKRHVNSVTVKIAPSDRKYFADTVAYELSALPDPTSGEKYFASSYAAMFHMFKTFPLSYDATSPFSETIIEGRDCAIMHAPSEMTFDMPKNAKRVSGKFGFVSGAYTNGGKTNGAEFLVYWSNGNEKVDLFQKFLDPVAYTGDRGLQTFDADVTGLKGGKIYLKIKPGPYNDYAWDWTGWTDIEIK